MILYPSYIMTWTGEEGEAERDLLDPHTASGSDQSSLFLVEILFEPVKRKEKEKEKKTCCVMYILFDPVQSCIFFYFKTCCFKFEEKRFIRWSLSLFFNIF